MPNISAIKISGFAQLQIGNKLECRVQEAPSIDGQPAGLTVDCWESTEPPKPPSTCDGCTLTPAQALQEFKDIVDKGWRTHMVAKAYSALPEECRQAARLYSLKNGYAL